MSLAPLVTFAQTCGSAALYAHLRWCVVMTAEELQAALEFLDWLREDLLTTDLTRVIDLQHYLREKSKLFNSVGKNAA